MTNSMEYTIPSLYLQEVGKVCAEKYIDYARLLAGAGIFSNLDNVSIDHLSFIKVLNDAARMSGDNIFGFLVGKGLNFENAGKISNAFVHPTCIANMYPLFEYLINFENWGSKHQLIIKGNKAYHDIRYLFAGDVNYDQIVLLSLTGVFNSFRFVLGRDWRPSAILFRQKKPANIEMLETYFNCPVIFNAERDAIEFPAADVYQQTEQQLAQSRAMKIEQAKVLASCQDLDRLVACYIEFNIANDSFDKVSIAQYLGVHPKVLQQCLAAKGFTFKQILQDVRKKLACKLLQTTQLTVAQVAAELSYAEAHTFIRAFKRWTGSTPFQWRKDR